MAYDIRDRKTFESIDERYTTLLETAAENCAIILAGTKSDLLDENNRQVTTELATNKVKELSDRWKSPTHKSGRTPCFETSALTGDSIKEIFEFVFETLCPATVEDPEAKKTLDLTAPASSHRKKCNC